MTLNELLVEWSYRTEKGYPDMGNPSDILVLKEILERLENNQVDLEASKKDYERLLILNDHIDNLFKEKLNNIKSIGLKNKTS